MALPAQIDVLNWTPAWMVMSERLMLYALVYGVRPECYLEIGTFKGGSALIVSAAMDAYGGQGRLFCIDPQPQISPEHWQQLAHRTTVVKGGSPIALAQAYQTAGRRFDFALIDGDHSYQGALRDATAVLDYVEDGAYLVFHDSYFGEVATALRDFVEQQRHRIVDFGSLTREVTYQPDPQGSPVRWGGLRVMQVRRNLVAR